MLSSTVHTTRLASGLIIVEGRGTSDFFLLSDPLAGFTASENLIKAEKFIAGKQSVVLLTHQPIKGIVDWRWRRDANMSVKNSRNWSWKPWLTERKRCWQPKWGLLDLWGLQRRRSSPWSSRRSWAPPPCDLCNSSAIVRRFASCLLVSTDLNGGVDFCCRRYGELEDIKRGSLPKCCMLRVGWLPAEPEWVSWSNVVDWWWVVATPP